MYRSHSCSRARSCFPFSISDLQTACRRSSVVLVFAVQRCLSLSIRISFSSCVSFTFRVHCISSKCLGAGEFHATLVIILQATTRKKSAMCMHPEPPSRVARLHRITVFGFNKIHANHVVETLLCQDHFFTVYTWTGKQLVSGGRCEWRKATVLDRNLGMERGAKCSSRWGRGGCLASDV